MISATNPLSAALRSSPLKVDALSSDAERLPERAQAALEAGVESLLSKLRPDRAAAQSANASAAAPLHWCAELEGDSILSSEYLLMKLILGQENDTEDSSSMGPNPAPGARRVGRPTLLRLVNHLRLVQRDDGTWGQYPGSPPDISACVKAYLALKCFGDSPNATHMVKARERILALGGAERCNTFSTFYLACLGCVSWDACPSIPPEIVLFPRWFPFHLDKVAAWTRTMILPLAICSALRPVRQLPPEHRIDELFVDPKAKARLNQPWKRDEPVSWTNFFLLCDRVLKRVQKHGLSPYRARALKKAEAWIIDRLRPETTEGLGAIFPPMVYLQIAFQKLGYARSHPVIQKAERDLDDFFIDEPNPDPRLNHTRIQPCFSPVWDTGIAMYALTEAGLTAQNSPELARACDWLIQKQVRMTGDWVRNLRAEDRSIRLGDAGPNGGAAWAFEYKNDWYPDVDDTAMVAKALKRAGDRPGESINTQTAQRAFRWIVAMQNDDGGWAAFDKTIDRPWMEAVPFADHNAMQDPSCADITGRTIESLITCGMRPDHPAITRALKYLLAKQEPEGCWWGRWGCNYIYGTWQALGGLSHAGFKKDHPSIQRAIRWIKSIQNADGGFGESANSYLDRTLMGQGRSSASQTAWGLACLLYACDADDPSVVASVRWLCDHQLSEDKAPFEPAHCMGIDTRSPASDELGEIDFVHDRAGSWNEHDFTGTGFPKVFYLRYNYYRHYFPVMSLARYLNARGAESDRRRA